MRYAYIQSPVGTLHVRRDEIGLTALLFVDRPDEPYAFDDDVHDDAFADVRGQLDEYFAGSRTEFDLPIHPKGTPFQHRVWQALRQIPYGETTSYGKVAASIDAPDAVRAVGLANGRNPIAIIVPCHRVIGANGSLTGYGGGLENKRWLLAHEAAHSGLFAAPSR